MRLINGSSLKIKFKTPQKLWCSQGRNHTDKDDADDADNDDNNDRTKTIMSPPGRDGDIIIWHYSH